MLDLTGHRYGDLYVEKFHHKDKYGMSYWCCICRCGKQTIATRGSLRSGHTKSCGCLQKEISKKMTYDAQKRVYETGHAKKQ